MPLIFTLAFRNLFHDRLRFIATVIGIVFSIVLVTVLRAIGSSRRYIYKVIICQALVIAVIGFSFAALIGAAILKLTAAIALPIVITSGLIAGLFLLTVAMCVASAIAAIVQVTRINPAKVFTR